MEKDKPDVAGFFPLCYFIIVPSDLGSSRIEESIRSGYQMKLTVTSATSQCWRRA